MTRDLEMMWDNFLEEVETKRKNDVGRNDLKLSTINNELSVFYTEEEIEYLNAGCEFFGNNYEPYIDLYRADTMLKYNKAVEFINKYGLFQEYVFGLHTTLGKKLHKLAERELENILAAKRKELGIVM